tara:strand:- start:355 stop:690 length:336 start_codon:yes stop_codon:yes gene_type:complete
MSEDRLTQECYLWFHAQYPDFRSLLFHVPNGGARNAREGAKMKTMGVTRGVSDFIFLWKGRAFFIELKTLSGTQSKDQLIWEEDVKLHGFDYYIIRTLTDFKKTITLILCL